MAKITFQNLTKTGHIAQKFDYTISFGFLLLKFLEFNQHIFSSLTIRQNFSFCLLKFDRQILKFTGKSFLRFFKS